MRLTSPSSWNLMFYLLTSRFDFVGLNSSLCYSPPLLLIKVFVINCSYIIRFYLFSPRSAKDICHSSVRCILTPFIFVLLVYCCTCWRKFARNSRSGRRELMNSRVFIRDQRYFSMKYSMATTLLLFCPRTECIRTEVPKFSIASSMNRTISFGTRSSSSKISCLSSSSQ